MQRAQNELLRDTNGAWRLATDPARARLAIQSSDIAASGMGVPTTTVRDGHAGRLGVKLCALWYPAGDEKGSRPLAEIRCEFKVVHSDVRR